MRRDSENIRVNLIQALDELERKAFDLSLGLDNEGAPMRVMQRFAEARAKLREAAKMFRSFVDSPPPASTAAPTGGESHDA